MSGDETTGEVLGRDIAQAKPSQPSVPCLTVLSGTMMGRVFDLKEGEFIIGRDLTASLVLRDESISRFHARVTVQAGVARVTDLRSKNGTFVDGERITDHELKDGEKIQCGAVELLKFSMQDAIEAEFQRRMYEAATRDGLLGLCNARHFESRLKEEVSFSRRHKLGLCVALLDVDRFKIINDVYGHAAGDSVLRSVAKALAAGTRTEDVLFRTGGDELAILFRNTEETQAMICLERIRRSVETSLVEVMDLQGEPRRVSVTFSAGLASLTSTTAENAVESLLAAADRALYRAKHLGRNRCLAAGQRQAKDPDVVE